jgi:hypothetical protein
LEIGSSLSSISSYPLTARKTGGPTSAYTQTEAATTTPVSKPSDVLMAEVLLHNRQSRLGLQQDFPDHRSRRALEAYSALEQIQQRDYVSRVLGIDEYA